jgi:hypothetical protein
MVAADSLTDEGLDSPWLIRLLALHCIFIGLSSKPVELAVRETGSR